MLQTRWPWRGTAGHQCGPGLATEDVSERTMSGTSTGSAGVCVPDKNHHLHRPLSMADGRCRFRMRIPIPTMTWMLLSGELVVVRLCKVRRDKNIFPTSSTAIGVLCLQLKDRSPPSLGHQRLRFSRPTHHDGQQRPARPCSPKTMTLLLCSCEPLDSLCFTSLCDPIPSPRCDPSIALAFYLLCLTQGIATWSVFPSRHAYQTAA